MRVQRCHSRPARPAHRALLETCALHRASLHCAASPCGSPSLLSLPAASGQREGSQSACAVLLVACHCLPISRVLAVDRSTFPWLCAASLASRRPALGHTSATLQPHTAPAQQCPARSSRCCHPPPDPCRTLGQPLCARCGGDPPDLWSPLGSFPAAALLPISGRARSLCLCAAGRWQPLSATPTLWEWVRAGMS